MQESTEGVRNISKCAEFVCGVARAEFCCLGYRHDAWLHGVLVTHADPRSLDQLRSQLAVFGRDVEQLRAQVVLGCATLVHVDVRSRCANY